MTQTAASTAPLIERCLMTDFVEQMEAAVGQGDWTLAASFFTPDARYRVGYKEPVHGVDGIRRYMEWQNERVRWTGHDLRMKFSRGEKAIFEVDSHFTRHADGAKLIVPCTDIYTFSNGLIADWRVYADTSAFNQ